MTNFYVADSKLATDEQLNYIADKGGRAITIMPRTWGEYSDFKEELKKGDIEKKLILSNKKAIEETSKIDGIFPLISTDTGLKAEEAIKAYKHQPFIEVKFDHVKNLHEVSSPLFKRTDRFEALLFVEWIALAIEAMIERDLKKAAEINGLPLHPEGRMTKNPTFKQLSRLFENVVRYIVPERKLRDHAQIRS